MKEVYGLPLYGIKTGLNEAFVIDTHTKEKLCREDPRSAALLKPFLEGKDLKRWRSEPSHLWLIYIPRNRIKIDDFPAIRNWLTPFRQRLENRATKQAWYELQQAQEAYAASFYEKKIAYKDIGASAPFHIESTGALLANTGYFIPSGDAHLVAYLNSTLHWFIYLTVSAQIRGGFVRFFSNHLGEMPLPFFDSDAQKAELAALAEAAQTAAEKRYALQQEITRRIPDLATGTASKLTERLKAWWDLPDFAAFQAEVKKALKSDIPLKARNEWENWIAENRTQIHALSAQITAVEGEINAKVYALFNLTPEEIALLEANI